MSVTLYVVVVLQGTTLSFSPGYTTAAECLQQYKGPNVACFNYDPEGASWTAFFKLPDGGFRVVRPCRRRLRQTPPALKPNPATFRSAASNIRR
jgi:hypothetical protein